MRLSAFYLFVAALIVASLSASLYIDRARGADLPIPPLWPTPVVTPIPNLDDEGATWDSIPPGPEPIYTLTWKRCYHRFRSFKKCHRFSQ